MDVKEIQAYKVLMEQKIEKDIECHVQEFYEKTGYTPSSIDVKLINISTISDKNKGRLIIDEVKTEINIFE